MKFEELNAETKLFINGEFVEGHSKRTIDIINPTTEEILCKVSEADEVDIDLAVQAAQKGFKEWNILALDKRVDLLLNLAKALEDDIVSFQYLESYDNGVNLGFSLACMQECVRYIKYYAGFCDKIKGVTFTSPMNEEYSVKTIRVPIGVVGCISPWNYPLMMSVWKIIPAIAAGCAVILKPSELTPLTTLRLAKLMQKVGFPKGVLNVVVGYGHIAGEALTRHKDVHKISFTGSTFVGRAIMKASAETNLKKVHLELGGKSCSVVCEDCDLDSTVDALIAGAFNNSSQNCICSSRILAHENVYKKLLEKLQEKLDTVVKVGKYDEEDVMVGPVISKRQFDSINNYIKIGYETENMKALTSKNKINFTKGYFVQPTMFYDVDDSSKLAREEIFGPVIVILKPFKTLDEAIERANSTEYGLGSAVFSSDQSKVEYFCRHSESGTIYVNCYDYANYYVPFGGMKQSGFGRDNGEEGMMEFTTVKAVYQQYKFKF